MRMNTRNATEIRARLIERCAHEAINYHKGEGVTVLREQCVKALQWATQCYAEPAAYVASLAADASAMSALYDEMQVRVVALDAATVYRLSAVSLEGEHVTPAYLDGRTWNGWARPLFPLEQAFNLLNSMQGRGGWGDTGEDDLTYSYDPASGIFTICEGNPADSAYTYEIAPDSFVDAEGVSRVGYSIGSGAWIWSAEDAE